MADFDLITDILQRLQAKGVQIAPAVATAVDIEARQEWGAQRHYIPSVGDVQRQQLYQRDAKIRAMMQAGCSVSEVALKWGISERRVKQIVRG